ncbi:MAG: ComF family protein [Candidatus Paceibacterota bacterium]
MQWNIWDIVFPKKCINCRREGSYLCEDCLSLVEINPFRYCLCEKMEKKDKCDRCKDKNLDKLFSASSFKNKIVKESIHRFKYGYIKDLAKSLALIILSHLQIVDAEIDRSFIIIPVPLSNKKKRRRGFNQSEEIGKIISEATGIPLLSDALVKIKETSPQMELGREERLKNLRECFEAKTNFKNKNIILLDDVYTTGSTLEECARVIKLAGAEKVWGVTVAREVDQSPYFV